MTAGGPTVPTGLDALEVHAAWTADDVADPATWTVELTDDDREELDRALGVARSHGGDPLLVTAAEFPLDGLAATLAAVGRELVDGRGFVRIRGLERDRYDDDELSLVYWGIGMHLGEPWPQNRHGHVLGDVVDQGKRLDDPTARGNEVGSVALDYHTDGSDLVGLLCLRRAHEGGLSYVANAVAIHNHLVGHAPELAATLYEPFPYDLRGEERPGGRPWYPMPVFTRHHQRLFVRFIPEYIRSSQRHDSAPRLFDGQRAAIAAVEELATTDRFHVAMDLEPGEVQFINNYHVLHARSAYVDDAERGRRRHLKRLWLASPLLTDRPRRFQARGMEHWAARRSVSSVDGG